MQVRHIQSCATNLKMDKIGPSSPKVSANEMSDTQGNP